MINWKRFLAVWPLTASFGTVLCALLFSLYSLVEGNLSLDNFENFGGWISLLVIFSMICSLPVWLLLILLARFVLEKQKKFKTTRLILLVTHLILGVATFVIAKDFLPQLSQTLIMAISYIGVGQLLLYRWGLKPKALP